MGKYIYGIVFIYLFAMLLGTTYATNCNVNIHDEYDMYNILDATDDGNILSVQTNNPSSVNFERKITFQGRTEDYSGFYFNKGIISENKDSFIALLEKPTDEFKGDFYILKDWKLSEVHPKGFITNLQFIDGGKSYAYLEEVGGLSGTYYLYINGIKQDYDDVQILGNDNNFSFLYRKGSKEYISSGGKIIYERVFNQRDSLRLSTVYFLKNSKDYIYEYKDNGYLNIVKNGKNIGKYPEDSITRFIGDHIYIRYTKNNLEYLYIDDKKYGVYKNILSISSTIESDKIAVLAVPLDDKNFIESDRYSHKALGNLYIDKKLEEKQIPIYDINKYLKIPKDNFNIVKKGGINYIMKGDREYYSTVNDIRYIEQNQNNTSYTVFEYTKEGYYYTIMDGKKIEGSFGLNKFSKFNNNLIYFLKNENGKKELYINNKKQGSYDATYIYNIYSFNNVEDVYIIIGEPMKRKLLHYSCNDDINNIVENIDYKKELIIAKNLLEKKPYGEIVIGKIDMILANKSISELNILLKKINKIKDLSEKNTKYKKYIDIINYFEFKIYDSIKN